MRDILFRGKRVDNGEWIEGHYGEYMLMSGASIPCISIPNKEAVCGSICYDVEASTVGQYTGLNDKNGKKIFEGDILYSSVAIEEYSLIVVRFDGGLFFDYYLKELGECHDTEAVQNKNWTEDCEVIGNIHDNPELLEVE